MSKIIKINQGGGNFKVITTSRVVYVRYNDKGSYASKWTIEENNHVIVDAYTKNDAFRVIKNELN